MRTRPHGFGDLTRIESATRTCPSFVVSELARRTGGANRLIGRDINPYLLREARALARREGLLDWIDFSEGLAEALPLPDGA